VGVLVWLAHCGCFIPAHKAVMGLVDAILTRIASLESVATQQSTFAIELMWRLDLFKGRKGAATPVEVRDNPVVPFTQKAFYTSVVLRGLFGDAAPPAYMSYTTLERRERLLHWLDAHPLCFVVVSRLLM
jgi:hypothetical protein